MSSSLSHWGGKISLWLAVHCTMEPNTLWKCQYFSFNVHSCHHLFLLLKTKILNIFLDRWLIRLQFEFKKALAPFVWYSVEKRTIYSMHTHGYIIVHTGLSIAKWTNNMHPRKSVSLFVANTFLLFWCCTPSTVHYANMPKTILEKRVWILAKLF